MILIMMCILHNTDHDVYIDTDHDVYIDTDHDVYIT